MSFLKQLIMRVILLTPWVFLIWLIGQGISGEMSVVLVFVLLFILIPGAIVVNLITVVAFQGHQAMKMMRNMQKSRDVGGRKLESKIYSDMKWWNPKRYR